MVMDNVLEKDAEESVDSLKPQKKNALSKNTFESSLNDVMPRLQVHTLETDGGCAHEVILPPDWAFTPLKAIDGEPKRKYSFELDPFQKRSIMCLHNEESVLVSAHTSAGKTVVAEYAIAMSLAAGQRVIYTTPIKALSNQKFREFTEIFGDVGLMTGDITIYPNASCLIMTTEILRSMLYRGSEVMREVAWVIFDEIHYMRDKERGYVWEETIILLPDNVHYVFLSATIPNATQFAEWICSLHKQPCHVVYTDYRPTPLQHYIFPAGSSGLHLVVDENGNFKEDNFNAAITALKNAAGEAAGDRSKAGRRGGPKGCSNLSKLVRMIKERNFSPVVVFSFSKKECEANAVVIGNDVDFLEAEQKELVDEVFHNAIDSLSEDDRQLPQVLNILPLLKNGIGIHHSGLLPLIKETIEVLFAEGLIKALFATETFAMGLNMPARTVMFTSAQKFDGKNTRWLTSGEYIQMSGRAGRRGKDKRGIVILMIDDKMTPTAAKQIVRGEADLLNSAFHLTYNMVLNLLRVEEINPEYMLERSFFQFQNFATIPGLVKKTQDMEKEYACCVVPREQEVSVYYKIRRHLENLRRDLESWIHKPQYALPFLSPGRLVFVRNDRAPDEDGRELGWAVLVNFMRKPGATTTKEPVYVVDVLLPLKKSVSGKRSLQDVRVPPESEIGEMCVIPVELSLIKMISAVRVYIPEDLKSRDKRQSVLSSLKEIKKRFDGSPPLLDPINDMNVKDAEFSKVANNIEAFEKRMKDHPLHDDSSLQSLLDSFSKKEELGNQLRNLKTELKQRKSLLQMQELRKRKRVLRRMEYCTADDIILTKGNVACEIDCSECLVLTDLILNNVFNDMSAALCCALLSCFVFDERTADGVKIPEELTVPFKIMQDTARRIARITRDCKIEIDEEEFVEKFKPGMMGIVNSWATGASFASICQRTNIFEGSVIRCMRRLEELLRQMQQAARTIGNSDLENKFAKGQQLIKRDIVFAGSLYL